MVDWCGHGKPSARWRSDEITGDGDAKYALTKNRQVELAGRGGRGDDGKAAGELTSIVVQ